MSNDGQIQRVSDDGDQRIFPQPGGVGIIPGLRQVFRQQQQAVGRQVYNEKDTQKEAGSGNYTFPEE